MPKCFLSPRIAHRLVIPQRVRQSCARNTDGSHRRPEYSRSPIGLRPSGADTLEPGPAPTGTPAPTRTAAPAGMTPAPPAAPLAAAARSTPAAAPTRPVGPCVSGAEIARTGNGSEPKGNDDQQSACHRTLFSRPISIRLRRPLPIIFLRQHDRSGSRIVDPVSKGSNDFGVSVVGIKIRRPAHPSARAATKPQDVRS